jgi:hypothetical protein
MLQKEQILVFHETINHNVPTPIKAAYRAKYGEIVDVMYVRDPN